jgi:plastocyanin
MWVRLAALLVGCACLVGVSAARAEQLRALVRDSDGNPLPNAVVVVAAEDGKSPPARPIVEVVDQIDKEFVPYVKPVRVGSYVQFPNKDDIRHHVYSFSPAKKFELPLYRGTPAQPVLFDKVGVVKLGCNIHDWMVGYVYVAETPYFGKTTREGLVSLDSIPPGRYRARVWHPRMRSAEADTVKEVDLQSAAAVSLEWRLRLNPEFRPPRVPMPGDSGYR